MVRVPVYQGPGLQPTPVVQFESPTVRPMEDVVSPQIQQMGQSMAQLGQGMQEVGMAQMRQAQRDQDELDRADAIRAFVDYKGRVSERLNNDQTGYFRTQGEQAYGANKTAVLEELAKYREEIGRTLTSPGARQLFGQRADADDLQTFTAMDSHAGDQRNKYIQSQEKALIDSEIEDLQKFHGNPEFGNRMQALMDNIRDSRAMRGLNPKVVEQAQKEVQATVYSGAIDDIAGKDPVKALEALNKFAGTGALPPKYVTDKRAELQRKVDEVVGDLHGFQAWDDSKGNPTVAKITLDRQRLAKELTPSQFRQALSAVALQEASQREQRAAYEQDTYDEAIRRLSDPKVNLDNFSEAEKDKLVKANRWDDVVQFVSQGRQRYDNPAEVRRAEDYLLRVQNGEAEPMSELQFRRMFFTNMSDGTYNDLSSINRGYLSAVAKASGGGRGQSEEEKSEEKLLNVNLQEMLNAQGFQQFSSITSGVSAQLDATDQGKPTTRSKAGLTLLRFRSYFDPIYKQLREKGNNGKPMEYGAALQQAFKTVMQMPKGSDGVYDWERVRGTVPAEKVSYPDADGKALEFRSFKPEEVSDAEAAWAKQNPQLVAAGMSASPGMLVPIMSAARKKIRTATTIQRDSMPGMVSFEALALQAQTIRPDKTLEEVRKDILGDANDNSRGAFRDRGSPVRTHDIVIDTRSDVTMLSGQVRSTDLVYAQPEDEASAVVENARGVSLAAANRYLQNIAGEQFDLVTDEPPPNKFLSPMEATIKADMVINLAGGSSDVRLMTLSDEERATLLPDARQALAAFEVQADSSTQRAQWEVNDRRDQGRFGKRSAYDYSRERLNRLRTIVDVLSTPYNSKWDVLDPSPLMAQHDAQLAVVPTPSFIDEVAPKTERVYASSMPDVSALTPIRSVQRQNLLPSERVLLDQVRALDRVEQALADTQLNIPELAVQAPSADRSKERSDAVAALLQGDVNPARKVVEGNQRELAAATWIYENVLANIPRIDRSLRQAEMRPMPQPEIIAPGSATPTTIPMRDRLSVMQEQMRAQLEGQLGYPKLLPSERRVFARLTEAFEQRVKLETLMTPDISPQGEDALRTLMDMQDKVLQGELREPEQFLGAYGREHAMAVAVQALTVKAMQKMTENPAVAGQYASRSEAAAAATRRAARLRTIMGKIEQEPLNNLLLKSKKQ